jgi:hypothetical protein
LSLVGEVLFVEDWYVSRAWRHISDTSIVVFFRHEPSHS